MPTELEMSTVAVGISLIADEATDSMLGRPALPQLSRRSSGGQELCMRFCAVHILTRWEQRQTIKISSYSISFIGPTHGGSELFPPLCR